MTTHNPVLLSVEQQIEHGLESVEAVRLQRLGDGWVIGDNHLQGSLVHKRAGDREYGRKTWHDLVPVANELQYINQVTKSIEHRRDELAGSYAPDGSYLPGELDKFNEAIKVLLSWSMATPDDKQAGRGNVAEIFGKRERAINPTEIAIAGVAGRIASFKDSLGRDNPGAILTQTPEMQTQMVKRYADFVKQLKIDDQRTSRSLAWLFNEDRLLRDIDLALNRAIQSQNIDDIDRLLTLGRAVRFHVQPFNYLEVGLGKGQEPEDDEPLLTLETGLQFMQLKNYLLTPFRQITSKSKAELESDTLDEREIAILAISERLATAEGLPLSGEYKQLVDRLLPLGKSAVKGLMVSSAGDVLSSGEDFKTLVLRHCLPREVDKVDVWYGHRLRQAA